MLSEANDVSGRCPHYWTHHQTSALCDGVQGSPGSGQEVRFSQDCRWFTGQGHDPQVRFTVCVKVYFMNWFKLTRPFTLPVTPGIQTSNYRASEGWSTWKTRLKHVSNTSCLVTWPDWWLKERRRPPLLKSHLHRQIHSHWFNKDFVHDEWKKIKWQWKIQGNTVSGHQEVPSPSLGNTGVNVKHTLL